MYSELLRLLELPEFSGCRPGTFAHSRAWPLPLPQILVVLRLSIDAVSHCGLSVFIHNKAIKKRVLELQHSRYIVTEIDAFLR